MVTPIIHIAKLQHPNTILLAVIKPIRCILFSGIGYSVSLVTMSVFEQIRPFVNLCQAMENNLITTQFSRFTFSFEHRVTRWFLFILAVQIVSICFAGYFAAKINKN